jgi:hypothetical protein
MIYCYRTSGKYIRQPQMINESLSIEVYIQDSKREQGLKTMS